MTFFLISCNSQKHEKHLFTEESDCPCKPLPTSIKNTGWKRLLGGSETTSSKEGQIYRPISGESDFPSLVI